MARIGPYDHFAVEWGYRQYADDEAQEKAMRVMFESQITNPMFRYGGGSSVDPNAQTEDLTGDGVEATRLGLLKLERVASYLVEATSRPGEDYSLLQQEYNALISQWNRELGHVVTIVGGIEQINLYYGDADQRFFPISADRQREAATFLIDNAFTTPQMFIDRDIIARLTAGGVADRVLSAQSRVLRQMMSRSRIARMADAVESEEALPSKVPVSPMVTSSPPQAPVALS